VIGALSLYGSQPGPIEEADVALARAFADMATIGILHERAVRGARELAEQLRTALSSRIAIEQAKGMLAERTGLEVGDAFEVIRAYARSSNQRLRVVAADLVSEALPMDVVVRGRAVLTRSSRPSEGRADV
jgi:AmiR/NasT family two-component response regulator